MADIAAALPANNAEAATPKKASKKAVKSARPKASHPPTAVMVTNAIKNLKERGGSSLQAIKKYISSTYKVDAEKLAPFIKKFIKASVVSGSLVQTKGKGASGSFKLSSGATSKAPSSPSVTKVARRPAAKKPSKPRARSVEKPAVAAKKSPAKKAARPKKVVAVAATPKAAAPKPRVAKPKSPPKAKRAAKAPTKKPKSPKPKTTKPKAAAKAKKAAPKRK